MNVANGVRFQRLTDLPVGPGAQPRHVVGPETSDADERFQAVAASALSNLTPAPDAGGLSRNLFSQKEIRKWALP
jgi:hypothetical protein